MKKKILPYINFVVFVAAIIQTSCKKFIEVDGPADQMITSRVFTDEEAATAAVRGIYSQVMQFNNYIGNGALSLYPSLSADEIIRTTTNPIDAPFSSSAIPPSNFTVLNNLWKKGYYHIYQANSIIANLEASTALSTDVKNQLAGEAKFFRAFFHFYLTNLFGPVPLLTSPDYTLNATIGRSDTALVYQAIVKDLTEAKALLSSVNRSPEKTRVSKDAVTALLARVYLYTKNWEAAENEASQIIDGGRYSLTALDKTFLPNSPEAILQFVPAQTQIFNTAEGFSFLPFSPSVLPSYKLTDHLLSSFEPGDQRRAMWVGTSTVNGNTYYYPFKYKVKTGMAGEPKKEYNMVLRLAELYLIRAEARTRNNNMDGARADLDIIRVRAGLPNTIAADQSGLLEAVEKERRAELFTEWGHRWFDLKRTGKADAVLQPLKAPNWQSTDVLYPIPQSEMLANPSLLQNPGY